MPHVQFLGGNNVTMHGTEFEDKQFLFCPDEDVPFVLDIAGVTPPTPSFYISRKCCDHWVIIFVAEGQGSLEYNGEHYDLKPLDTMILAPGSRNCYYPDRADPFKLIWINFFCDWMGDYLEGLSLSKEPVVRGVQCGDKLLEIFRLAKTTPNNNHIMFQALRILQDILISLAEKVCFETRVQTESRLALEIKTLLDEAVYGKADVNEIAAKLYISKSAVYREFEKYYGESPYQYVLTRKINLAKSLLTRTGYSVADIARKLAFADEFYFSNIFKKKTGHSPSAYRKLVSSGATD